MTGKKVPGYYWRRLSQLLAFGLFLFLFIKTDYSGSDEIPYAVNLLFRIDPLLALAAMLATGTVIVLMLPALITLLLTLVLGRGFCGWLCPMGGLLDACHPLLKPRPRQNDSRLRQLKFYLLAGLLAGAWFGLPAAGYLDPFSLLVRGLALTLYPAVNAASTKFFTFTYQQAPDWVNAVSEPFYGLLKATVLPFHQKHYELALLSGLLLGGIILLELVEHRFFCRNLCPLGGLLAAVARFARLRGRGGSLEKCGKCQRCREVCRMGAIDGERRISPLDCNLCLDCVARCPANRISFSFDAVDHRPAFNLSRRGIVGSLAFGALLPLFMKSRTLAAQADPDLVRPPGARPEEEFLDLCVRCSECMKVCIGNGLQPTWLEAGIEGIFTPRLMSRTGYCEYNCTLCGQVCPTGAIERLALPEKQRCKIGNASFDRDRCLPYAKGIPCIVCEEHCPTPDKAIKFRYAVVRNSKGEEVTVQQPHVLDELCTGCGICEHRCPLPGRAGVRISSDGESRNPLHSLPDSEGSAYGTIDS